MNNDEVVSVLSTLVGDTSSLLPELQSQTQQQPTAGAVIKTPTPIKSIKERNRTEKWVEEGFSEILQPEEIITKHNFVVPFTWEHWRKFGLQLAKNYFFGERLLSLSSLGGRDNLLSLNPTKLKELKELLSKHVPENSTPASFENNWYVKQSGVVASYAGNRIYSRIFKCTSDLISI